MQARRLPARQGMVWVIAGFRLFRAHPALLTMLAFVYLTTLVVMLLLPSGLGSVLFPVLQPLLALAIANGCRGIAATGRRGPLPDLLAGIRNGGARLIKLGVLQLLGSLLTVTILLVLDGKPDTTKPDDLLRTLALAAVLSLPMLLAFWFAPLLTAWHDVPPLKSVFFSFVAALRNWRAIFVYGLTLAAITLLPTVLALLAAQVSEVFGQIMAKAAEILTLVFLLPIFLTGSYIGYRDIFVASSPAAVDE